MDMNRADTAAARTIGAPSRSARQPMTTRWSTRPGPPKRKPAGADKDLADRAAQNKDAWARRHPHAAKAERHLRKERAGMLDRWGHKNEGTPETHEHASRRNQGALARLYETGAIDAEQLAGAVEIAQVHERIGADVSIRTASLETRVDVTRMGDGTFFERLGNVRREVAYTRWRNEIEGPIGAVLDMIVGEPVGFTIVARRYRIHNRKAKRLLIAALDLWPRILGQVAKELDQGALSAAQAAIL